MARIRLFAVFAIAILAGGTFAFGTYRYIQDRPGPSAALQTHPVVVAAANLDIGADLRREDLKVIDWPADSVPAGTFSDPQEIVGRGLIQPVVQNAPVLAAQMPPKEAGAGLPPVIPEGFRAVSVRVDDVIGVAGYVLPGTRVDVVATVNPTDQHPDTTSKVILTNVQVLTAGTKIERDADQNKPVTVNVVTLLVDPVESERLTLASTEGKIQLALRNPLDMSAPQTPGIKPAALLGLTAARQATTPSRGPRASSALKSVAVVAAAPPAPTVEIIRGDKRAQEVLHQE
jgi:pilus assembly protein CpaB